MTSAEEKSLHSPRRQGVHTTCPYCGVGCGVIVTQDEQGVVEVHGDREHPANFGRLCSKGTALGETVDLDGRLLRPVVNGAETDWATALDTISERFARVIEAHGPDAVAFYVSGQLLTEDYYVANKLMKGFIGSANIDTNSRLCMSSAVAAHKRSFGSDTVPGNYEDLEQADLLVLIGTNLAWCHPVLYQRILAAKKQRPEMRIVVIDPRRTPTAESADLHLPLRSGTDAFLFDGLLSWLDDEGCVDEAFVRDHTQGLEVALNVAHWHAPSAGVVAAHCDLDTDDLACFFQWFAETDRVVSVFSQGINQSSSGTDKGNAVINCHLFSGRIGKPGMGPFSVTGQPNAMGGREVGGLANQLAAHMDIADPSHRELLSEFWQAPRLAEREGLKAVELFQAIESGRVKALWVMATNPAVSLPDSQRVRKALASCEFLVVSDCVAENDTLQYADIKLPALAWGEKSGTVTNSERRISRQRAFLPAPGEARADWWALSEVARRMGYSGFDYAGPEAVFDEHARLSAFGNEGLRDFDIGALSGLSAQGYDDLQPVQWPCPRDAEPAERCFSDGHFFTHDRRARFIPVVPQPPACTVSHAFPLSLNTGRVRDHWHTMTRTARSPRLSGHIKEPFVAIHPDDAVSHAVQDGGLARVSSPAGQVTLRVEVSDSQPRGQIFVPIHWNDQFAAQANVGSLVGAAVDPISGQPEFKYTPAKIVSYQARWHGFLLTRREIGKLHATYWSKARRQGVWHYELAGEDSPEDWAAYARQQLCHHEGAPEWREFYDSTQANYRGARFVDGRLDAILIVQPGINLPPRDWLTALFKKPILDNAERNRVLRGTPPDGEKDIGKIVCSCFSVGVNTLVDGIRNKGLRTPEAIGDALQAGTNCGSCLPELRQLIANTG